MFSQLELPGLSLGSAVTLTCPGLGFVPTVAALCAVAVVFPTSCCCEGASVLSDSVRPHRRQPPRLPRPWDSPGESTGAGCHYLLQCMTVKGEREVAQPCPTLREPMGCSPPGSSAPGILQARALEWVPLPSPPWWPTCSLSLTTSSSGVLRLLLPRFWEVISSFVFS